MCILLFEVPELGIQHIHIREKLWAQSIDHGSVNRGSKPRLKSADQAEVELR